MTPSETRPLDYAPRPSRRKRWFVCILGLLLLGTAALGAWKWGLPYWRQWQYLRIQRRCLAHTLPPNTVVYEDESTRAATLIAQGGDYLAMPARPADSLIPTVQHVAGYHPRFLRQLSDASGSPPNRTVVLFLHERRSASGNRRLVRVTMAAGWEFSDRLWRLGRSLDTGQCYSLASWAPGSTMVAMCRYGYFEGEYTAATSLRFFAGQPDPNDPSHFTIAYELRWPYEEQWHKGTLDGWLRDDDTIDLRVRSGPLRRQDTDGEPPAIPPPYSLQQKLDPREAQ